MVREWKWFFMCIPLVIYCGCFSWEILFYQGWPGEKGITEGFSNGIIHLKLSEESAEVPTSHPPSLLTDPLYIYLASIQGGISESLDIIAGLLTNDYFSSFVL